MRNIYIPFLLCIFSSGLSAQVTAVTHLQCAYKVNPICVDVERPALSWQLLSVSRNISQTAYRVIVADDPALLLKNIGNVWDSKKVPSDQSIQVLYGGIKLQPAKAYCWKVMIWDNYGNVSTWSRSASWQMGLLRSTDWHGARWIGYDVLPDSLQTLALVSGERDTKWDGINDVMPLIRKEFVVGKAVRKATVYICGLGQFELRLNGSKIGDHFLDPGWTKYDKHAMYVTFDVTGHLLQGFNAMGVMLGNGFLFVPGQRYRKMSGGFGHPKMICRLLIEYQDGSSEDIISDPSWKTAAGPVTFSSIYGGEDYDARLEQAGWDRPFFNDRAWKSVLLVDGRPQLDAQMAEPLKIFERFSPLKIREPKPGVWVYDLGQNASGIPYLKVEGRKGSVVKITPAELITDEGLAMQKWVGEPVNFNYTLKGSGREIWQPRFTYYGFRYLQVEGAVPQGEPNPHHFPVLIGIQGLHTRNAAARIGQFSCSKALFNKTFALIDWAIQSNMASIFTDCPHREKLGWLEEAHLVGPSIRYNYDIANLVHKVVRDMIHSQTPDGLIPDIAPEYTQFENGFRDSPEWGSSGILLPWYSYEWYGDLQILEESYTMMARYIEYLGKRSKGHILYFGLGDWYDIGPKPPGESQLTPSGITSTAIYYYDLTILSRAAMLLGKAADAASYSELGNQVRQAFNRTFFNSETKQYGTGSQTANAMAIYMGLVDSADKPAVLDHIVKDIHQRHNSLTAGDIGYRYLLRVLDDAGRSDVIYEMNSRSDRPGYGYQLAHGATALTESWQAYRNVSNNHFMLGHLMEWLYSGLAGIRPAANAVAFREIDIRPEPAGDVNWASASFQSPYGLISSRWKKEGDGFQLIVRIPANTRARIFLPAGRSSVITESGKKVTNDKLIQFFDYRDGRVIYKVGSGLYYFIVRG